MLCHKGSGFTPRLGAGKAEELDCTAPCRVLTKGRRVEGCVHLKGFLCKEKGWQEQDRLSTKKLDSGGRPTRGAACEHVWLSAISHVRIGCLKLQWVYTH